MHPQASDLAVLQFVEQEFVRPLMENRYPPRKTTKMSFRKGADYANYPEEDSQNEVGILDRVLRNS